LKASERCLFRRDERIPLTVKEFDILALFLEEPGRVVQKQQLSQRLWPGIEMDESNLFHHLSALRKKLKNAGSSQTYIETIPGVGYRFVARVSFDNNPVSSAASKPTPKPRKWLAIGCIALVTVAAGLIVYIPTRNGFGRTSSPLLTAPALTEVRTVPDSFQLPRLITEIKVGRNPSYAIFIGSRNQVYVSDQDDDSVSVIDVTTDHMLERVAVGKGPNGLALSPDGTDVYIAQYDGVGVIDTARRSFHYASRSTGPVQDLVVSRDGHSAYLALGFHGLGKFDLRTGVNRMISNSVFARAVALTPSGDRLYVSYQAGGPDGSWGHDSIGYFDTATDRLSGTIKGFANVGECLTVSPDDKQVWENGADACDGPQYDHAGCPAVPAGLLNILSVPQSKLVRAIGFKGTRLQCTTFSHDGTLAAVGSTTQLMLLRPSDQAVLTSVPMNSSGKIAFTADDGKAYVPLTTKSALAVIQIVIQIRAVRMANRADKDGLLQLAIPTSPEFDAEAIDPSSLHLRGKATKDASIQGLAGLQGHSLVVRFDWDQAQPAAPMIITGKTYSGIPIRATVEPF
jgi:YVTN family beta-propeller protein